MSIKPLHIADSIQEAGKRIAQQKVPTWYACQGIQYPVRLSLEQCSSEDTARYKATLVQGNSLVDLTGGMGVDCSFLSQSFTHTTYVEQQEELCNLARHNFACLGKNITVINAQCEDFLAEMWPVDVIFIDPARRDNKGGKVALLGDCTPNLLEIGAMLLQKCHTLLIKLSPMIDIESVLNVFHSTYEVHIVAVKNECKEVLVCVKGEWRDEKGERRDEKGSASSAVNEPHAAVPEPVEGPAGKEPCIICANLPLYGKPFVFTRGAEATCMATYSQPLTYLYEPNAAILKAGGFKQIAQQFGVCKLHSNSHLYTSDTCITHFPGRIFAIERVTKVQRKEIADIDKANLSIRNFPGSVADLRKKLKLKDGGDVYVFATTLHDNSKVLIVGRKLGVTPLRG
ncbi:MAG: SAM-dependent methyltransferase [Paludibacteraceae bacterium]|nr:SAM-dependent methyltransferase [Paludibacteraceae bacterium]